MARPSLTPSTLFVSPKLITQHVLFGLFSAVKGPHCCRCKSKLQSSWFFSAVWGRMPQDSPGRAWRSSSTVSQWPLRLKDPGWSHTASGTELTQGEPLFCWLGFAPSQEPSLSPKRQDRSLPLEITTNPSALTGTLLRDGSREVVCPGPLGWRCRWRFAVIPSSRCLPWHLWTLQPSLLPHRHLACAQKSDFCWSFTYLVGSERIPHNHLPILNESTQTEREIEGFQRHGCQPPFQIWG